MERAPGASPVLCPHGNAPQTVPAVRTTSQRHRRKQVQTCTMAASGRAVASGAQGVTAAHQSLRLNSQWPRPAPSWSWPVCLRHPSQHLCGHCAEGPLAVMPECFQGRTCDSAAKHSCFVIRTQQSASTKSCGDTGNKQRAQQARSPRLGRALPFRPPARWGAPPARAGRALDAP